MPRYAVYNSTPPAYAQGVDNLASAAASIFAPAALDAKGEAEHMLAYKNAQEAMKLQQIRDSRDARANARRTGNQTELFANAEYDPEMAGHIGDLNLAAYAAGVPSSTLPNGDPADPLNDPTLTRLAMGAKVAAPSTGLGMVFAEDGKNKRSQYQADQQLVGTKYAADRSAGAKVDAAAVTTATDRDPIKISTAVAGMTDDLTTALDSVFQTNPDAPLDPAVAADAFRLGQQYLADELAAGNAPTPLEAARHAHDMIVAANGGAALEVVGDWNPLADNRTTITGYVSPAADVFAPRPVSKKVTVKTKGTPPAPSAPRPKPAAPMSAEARADFSNASAAIAKGAPRDAVVQELLNGGYTREQIAAYGI